MKPWTCSLLLIAGLACAPSSKSASQTAIEFEVIAHGEPVDLDSHTRPGLVTVFDVYADWCPPCQVLNRSLVDLKRTYGDRLRVLKLDLISFDSDMAKTYGIGDLPYLFVYNEDQQLLKKGPSNQVLPDLIAHLNR